MGSKDAADRLRDEHSDWLCPIDDDRRTKTVAFVSDVPDDVLDDAVGHAAEERSERSEGGGQVPLSDSEKQRVGPFTGSNNVMKARAAKGVFLDAGVDDWTSWYDPELSVDEHREVAERAAREDGGRRLDAGDDVDDQLARAQKAADAGECDHARDHCEHGDPDACEFLKDSCGYADDEVASLLEDDRDVDDASEQDTLTGQEQGALSRAWSGYKSAISDLDDAVDTVREQRANAERAFSAINAIRRRHGQEPLHPERLHELVDDLAHLPELTTLDEFDDHDAGEFVDDRDDGQTDLDVETDVRHAQGQEARADVEAATEFGVDDRSDASRGVENDEEATEQRQFRDAAQGTL
ncbi:hypothetical protein GCM10009039_15040 [Halocalculus aciditolerans]|uniref:Uncharacterized protein n=2 Tax=Halocalculus aciditolerans TaxID=1383812 RepID=A0A830FB82_9EURY|nr:hypothetical protein GCM10009039_15040 [Halocalculus aciditolerans]